MDDRETRRATVLSTANGRLVVRMERTPGEDGEGCRACALKSLCGGGSDGHVEVRVPVPPGEEKGFAPGQPVDIHYKGASPALAAIVMFLPALAGLLLGGVAAHGYGAGDGALVLGCLSGAALGLGVTFALSRLTGALKPAVELTLREEGRVPQPANQ